jgi:hypothetical protein
MATEVKRRRGTTSEHASFTGAVAELTVDLTKDTVVVHDGATQGGFPLLREDLSNVPTTAPFTHITLDTAIFDTSYTETESETQGTLYWNQDEETLSLVTNGETIELGQKIEVHVKNQTGSQINKGEVVYASGTLGASGRILVTKMIADGTIAAKRILGVAAENIANGADGKVVKFGKIRKVDTSAYSNGDILWVSTTAAGAFQNTEPVQADGEIALPIAYVVYSSASNGEIFVRITPIDENEYQNYDAGLADIAGLTPTDGNFIVGNGSNFVAESGNTARTSLGLGTGDSPTFAGLTVNGNGLTANGAADLNSTLNVQGVLTTQDNILDDGFSEGWLGTNWRIKADGSAELEELRVRGALRVYEFIAKQISTIGGSEILSIAQGRVVSVDSDNDTITVENVTGTAGNSFKVNDLFICQVTNINNDLESGGTGSIVKSVRGGVIGVAGNDIEVSITSGNLTDLVTGDLIVAYGNTSDANRQAIMYRNVDRSEDNLIMRLQTQVNEFTDLKAVGNTRVAFGDLNGYSGLSSETFGFFAGKNAEEHVLVTDTGIFFKDGLTIGAQLSSNVFKIGDNDNFLSFNTSNSSFEIKVDTFDLNTSFIQIADTIAKTSSTLTSSVSYSGDLSLDGLFFDAENYFGYLTDVEAVESNGYVFRVGEETSNFIEINSANGIAKINFDTFDLTSGNLRIKSAGTTYPSASANTEVTTSNVSDFRLATLANGFNTNSLAINNNRWVKFQFDYSQSVPGSFTAGITVTLEVSTDNSTFTDYGLFSDTRIDFNTNYFVANNATGNRLNVVDQSDSTKTEFKFTSSQTGSCTGTITMYFYVNEKNTTTHIRFNVLDSSGVTLSGASATNIGTRDYNPVTELNPSGIFTRLSDSLILSNGNTYIDYSEIT